MKVEGPGQTISSNALGGNELVWLNGWRGFCPGSFTFAPLQKP